MKNNRNTLVRVMALLALLGILLGVVGTGFMMSMPAQTPTPQVNVVSSEVNP